MRTVIRRIGDVCEVFDGPHATPTPCDEGPVYLGIPSILDDGSIDYENSKRISWEEYPRWTKRVTPQQGDVVFSYEANLDTYAIIPEGFIGCLGRRMAIMRPKKSEIIPRFLYYYMLSPQWKVVIASKTVPGATVNRIPIATYPDFPITVPNLETQRRIAGVLSAYDELIENNREQIKLLEEAARRLYKEWFVDLKFPGHETTPIIDSLPEGWSKRAINEVCERIQSGSTPSRKYAGFWSKEEYRWFKTAELKDCYLFDSEECISEEALNNTAVKLYPANTILMAIYASPTLGRLGILTEESTFNQAALALIPNRCYISVEWLYLKLRELRDEFNQIARGAGQQNISGEIVKQYEIVVPDKGIVSAFTARVSPLFKAVRNAQQKMNAAREARDRLLPELMSGEIEV